MVTTIIFASSLFPSLLLLSSFILDIVRLELPLKYTEPGEKDFKTAKWLCLVGGIFGLHRCYLVHFFFFFFLIPFSCFRYSHSVSSPHFFLFKKGGGRTLIGGFLLLFLSLGWLETIQVFWRYILPSIDYSDRYRGNAWLAPATAIPFLLLVVISVVLRDYRVLSQDVELKNKVAIFLLVSKLPCSFSFSSCLSPLPPPRI
jgi:hypothetical protein